MSCDCCSKIILFGQQNLYFIMGFIFSFSYAHQEILSMGRINDVGWFKEKEKEDCVGQFRVCLVQWKI